MKMYSTLLNSEVKQCKWPGYKEIDSPESIYYCGSKDALSDGEQGQNIGGNVAIVGTRACSAYGQLQAEIFSKELSQQGFGIVSGLAYGIDAAAHRACVKAGGRTIAVVAQGLDCIQPRGNLKLAQNIIENGGAVLSERELGYSGPKYEYLRRNRLISGLSLGVIIVEAAFKSGALNTAKHALEQGREVMVIPGRISDPKSQGCLKLIQQGAHLVRHPRDVVEILGFEWKKPAELVKESFINKQLNGLQAELYTHLQEAPAHLAELTQIFPHAENKLYESLIHLELEGWIYQGLDRRYRLQA